MPEDDARSDEHAQYRWSEELERDRMAALVMSPGVGYAGPGATDAEAPDEEDGADDGSDEGAADEEEDSSPSPAGFIQKAKLVWKALPIAEKMTIIVAVAKFALIVGAILAVLLIIVSCASSDSCVSDIGKIVAVQAWNNLLHAIFGL